MSCYAVIDTNVLVSGLLSSNPNAATVQVFQFVFDGTVTPVFSKDMLREYQEVLLRPKFKFDLVMVNTLLQTICEVGLCIEPDSSGVVLEDMKDLPFYEVVLSCPHTPKYLVTGNLKHFPQEAFILSPREFISQL